METGLGTTVVDRAGAGKLVWSTELEGAAGVENVEKEGGGEQKGGGGTEKGEGGLDTMSFNLVTSCSRSLTLSKAKFHNGRSSMRGQKGTYWNSRTDMESQPSQEEREEQGKPEKN